MMHPSNDDSQIVMETTQRSVEDLHHRESLHQAYLTADTTLGMDKWIASKQGTEQLTDNYMELDDKELQIKQEEIDAENDFWRKSNTTVGAGLEDNPIDLTLED
jgi:hypothetical protein